MLAIKRNANLDMLILVGFVMELSGFISCLTLRTGNCAAGFCKYHFIFYQCVKGEDCYVCFNVEHWGLKLKCVSYNLHVSKVFLGT